PTNSKELGGFLGLANFYRRFVKHFAKIATPLYTITNYRPHTFRKAWQEHPQLEVAFNAVKNSLCTDPVIVAPEPGNREFRVLVDASNYALGATLRQIQTVKGKPVERTIAFHSRKLSGPESRYSAYERELLAVKDTVLHWHHYLSGGHFTVFCDHRTVKHALQ
ncbi:DNA/RNA polymerase, partial [Ascobolus immersus RN42]